MDEMQWLMNHNFFPGKMKDFFSWMKMNSTVLNAEIEYAQQTLQVYFRSMSHTVLIKSYYDANPENAVVFCHNDLHGGNIMFNKEGDFNPDSLTLIDFDTSQYGFRAFDLLYNLANWNQGIGGIDHPSEWEETFIKVSLSAEQILLY